MKLELKHLAPYLPYKLKAVDYFEGIKLEREIVPSNIMAFVEGDTKAKPILRPISDLTKEIEINGEKVVPHYDDRLDGYGEIIDYHVCNSEMPYAIYQQLFEWHFDVFGLIQKGLAIDINTLNNE